MAVAYPKNIHKISIETYGCTANQSDSEMMAGILAKEGHKLAYIIDDADTIIVNTCTVKDRTQHRMISRINALQAKYPDKRLIVAGCMAQAQPELVRKTAPKASIIGTGVIARIADVVSSKARIEDIKQPSQPIAVSDKANLPFISRSPIIELVQINDGCLSHCAFCITKKARGDLHSFAVKDIIRRMKTAKKGAGAKEFHLTSQDCSVYGTDVHTDLSALLKQISKKVPGKWFLRVGMTNPLHLKRYLPRLIEAFKDERIFKFIHVPVQSGSDAVLKDMRRGHTSSDFNEVVAAFRKAYPSVQVWTDIIVGYPTETEEDFQKTLKLIEETRPDFVNVSKFGARPGTDAAKLKQLPSQIIDKRSIRMSALCKRIEIENSKRWRGWKGTVIVSEYNPKRKSFLARNFCYAPILLKGKNAKGVEIGQILDVEVVKMDGKGNIFGRINVK